MGLPPPPGVVEMNGDWLVPTVVGVDLGRKHNGFVLADNRTQELGAWDADALSRFLADFTVSDLQGTGFTPEDAVGAVAPEEDGGPPAMECQPYEHLDYVVLVFRRSEDWLRACEVLGVESRDVTVPGANGSRRKVGLGRCVDGARVLSLLERR